MKEVLVKRLTWHEDINYEQCSLRVNRMFPLPVIFANHLLNQSVCSERVEIIINWRIHLAQTYANNPPLDMLPSSL